MPVALSLIVSGTPHQTRATHAPKAMATYTHGRWNLAKKTKARPMPIDAHDTEIFDLHSWHVVQLTQPIVSFLQGLMVRLPHAGQRCFFTYCSRRASKPLRLIHGTGRATRFSRTPD